MRESDRRRRIACSGLLLASGMTPACGCRSWQTAKGLFYFRPLAFTLWKLAAIIYGNHNPVALYALNLVLQLVSALLVAWLAGRLWSSNNRIDWRRFYLVASLYLLFPFSYEAVPWGRKLSVFQWVAQDVHIIPLFGANLAIRVGLYRRSAGERLRAGSGDGQRLADDAASVVVRP